MTDIVVSPKQLGSILAKLIPAHEPVLVKGKPGVGKTDVVEESAKKSDHDLLISHPVTSDPTDAKGLPWKVDGREAATFLPYGDLEQALNTQRPLVWFLDDLGQASPAVQASFMQLVLARRVNGHKLPDHVTFIAATNRRADRAGVSGVLEPVKSRFTILELEPTIDDFVEWSLAHDMPAELIGFLRNRTELLSKFEPTADISNSPCPRNWAAVGRLFKILPEELRMASFAGRVGEGPALEFKGFLELLEKAPDPDAILMDPDNTPLPAKDEPGICMAVAIALAMRASQTTIGAIAIYAQRMYTEGMPEFSTLLLRDSLRRQPKIVETNAFAKIAATQMAKDIFAAHAD